MDKNKSSDFVFKNCGLKDVNVLKISLRPSKYWSQNRALDDIVGDDFNSTVGTLTLCVNVRKACNVLLLQFQKFGF